MWQTTQHNPRNYSRKKDRPLRGKTGWITSYLHIHLRPFASMQMRCNWSSKTSNIGQDRNPNNFIITQVWTLNFEEWPLVYWRTWQKIKWSLIIMNFWFDNILHSTTLPVFQNSISYHMVWILRGNIDNLAILIFFSSPNIIVIAGLLYTFPKPIDFQGHLHISLLGRV